MQTAMDSMTEVLAQAVYGLNLQELPLEVLASGHRPRVVSMSRQHRPTPPSASSSNVTPPNSTLSQLEIAPPRLTSFSSIFEGPPPLHYHRKPSRKLEVVEGGGSGGRMKLSRSATQQERSSPTEPAVTPLKRHSTPSGNVQPRPLLLSSQERPSTIEEDPSEPLAPKKPALPYQRLEEDSPSGPHHCKEPALLYQRLEEEESEEEVIANLNAASPSPIQEVPRNTPSPQSGILFLRRSGSDEIHRMSPPLSSPTTSQDDQMGMASGDCGRVPFSMRKSSSDGNINRVVPQHDYPLPTSPASAMPSSDRELALRRVATVASPTVTPGKPGERETSPTSTDCSTSTSSKRPLRKSLTMDSPEHPIPGKQ